jgi:hypothetical protein
VVFSEQSTRLDASCIIASEIWDGALDTDEMEALVNTLAHSKIVITVSRRGTAVLGPRSRQHELTQLLKTGFPVMNAMSDDTYMQLQSMMGRAS